MRVKAFIPLVSLLLFSACFKDDNFSVTRSQEGSGAVEETVRVPSEETRSVLLLYSAGFNSLNDYLAEDIEDLEKGFLPGREVRSDPVLLVYSRQPYTYTQTNGLQKPDYSTKTRSYLFRMYAGPDGQPHRDTLWFWSKSKAACSAETMKEVLTYVRDQFPAKSYGMIFSSHASGWLPATYYDAPSTYEKTHAADAGVKISPYSLRRALPPEEYPAIDPYPAVKSLGQDLYSSESIEMELKDFADAIPMHLDYLLLDACLSGGVEVAYQLRGKADIVGFSQTEILADGFDYRSLGLHLLKQDPDPVAVCADYFQHYDSLSGQDRSATISVVDTRRMDALAAVCRELFQTYQTKLHTMSSSSVQRYFRFDRHFFYDLEDILLKAGITAEEQAALEAALDECIVYKAATPSFLSISLNTTSGFSMYLPSRGTNLLDHFYRSNMAWNDATQLIP